MGFNLAFEGLMFLWKYL